MFAAFNTFDLSERCLINGVNSSVAFGTFLAFVTGEEHP